jgi:Family of unknown function (DUF6599)
MKRSSVIFALLLAALSATTAFGAAAQSMLPQAFGGWTKSASHISQNPAAADPTNASLFKEDGFTDFEQAEYVQPGRKITVKALRFADASGAYSAFTAFASPDVDVVDMGEKKKDAVGFSIGNAVTFYRQNILVTVTFDRTDVMTMAKVRELASLLPEASAPARKSPALPTYLPRVKQSFVKNSEKYVMGPVGLDNAGSPIPVQLVGFNQGAEVASGKYATSSGTATLMVISYPTPAIAGEHQRAIEAFAQNPQATTSPELARPIAVKRSGPIVALTAGQISSDEAKSLLASVNYEADVTWNQNTHTDNYAGFLVSLIALIAVMLLLGLIAGLAFGGFRVMVKKLYPGSLFDRPEDVEIIQLNIRK